MRGLRYGLLVAWHNRDALKQPWCWITGHDWEENTSIIGPSTGDKVVPMRFCWRCTKGFRLP